MKKIDVITSSYNDLSKLDKTKNLSEHYNCNLILYIKDDSLNKNQYDVTDSGIRIPNYGRCDYSFLWHIVNNYYDLGEYNIFTKINWFEQSIILEDLFVKCQTYDFCDVGEGKEYHIWTKGDNNIDFKNNTIKNLCVKNIIQTSNNNDNIVSFVDIYLNIFGYDVLPNPMVLWSHGPCFSVSKKLIHRHKIDTYKYLLDIFYNEYKDPIDVGKHYHDEFQRFWKILFTTNAADKYKIEYHEV